MLPIFLIAKLIFKLFVFDIFIKRCCTPSAGCGGWDSTERKLVRGQKGDKLNWWKRRGPAWTGSPGESFLGKMQDALRNTHLPWHKFRPFVHNGITFWQSNLTCEAVREHYKAMTEQDQGISISHISYMLHSIYGKWGARCPSFFLIMCTLYTGCL